MTIKDGGPAFPRPGNEWEGVSLRDWFAGMALQGMCAKLGINATADTPLIALASYRLASAMLAEREKRDA